MVTANDPAHYERNSCITLDRSVELGDANSSSWWKSFHKGDMSGNSSEKKTRFLKWEGKKEEMQIGNKIRVKNKTENQITRCN